VRRVGREPGKAVASEQRVLVASGSCSRRHTRTSDPPISSTAPEP
jgi:hypothetical protein